MNVAAGTLGRNLRLGPRQLLAKFSREWDRLLFSRFYLDRGGDHRDTVLVAGSGRSGTTWLASLINFDKSFRLVFEPFHNQKVPLWQDYSLRHYLSPGLEDRKVLNTVQQLLEGRPKNPWMNSYNRTLLARKRIVKAIRANLMLGYISKQFPKTPIIFLTRHPCAVAHSRQRLGWDKWETDLEVFLSQSGLVSDFLSDWQTDMRACNDPFEKEIWFWAVENLLPFQQLDPGKDNMLFVPYERLLTEPGQELNRIFSFLGLEHDDRLWNLLNRDSGTSWHQGGTVGKEERLRGWKSELEPGQLDQAMNILARTGLDELYGKDPLPLDHPLFS